MRRNTAAIVALLGLCTAAPAAPRLTRRDTARYPLTCAGITVGRSTDADVRRLYGDGLFVRNEGHGGGRYYVDPSRRVTLHVEIGVDRVIETVELSAGVKLPAAPASRAREVERAVASRLRAGMPLTPGPRVGDTPEKVRRLVGRPHEDTRKGGVRSLRYAADSETMAGVLYYEAEFRFEKDRLVTVRLYNGE